MQDDRNGQSARAFRLCWLPNPSKEGFPLVPRSIRSLLTICAVALLAPAAAHAQTPAPTEIDGSPLNVWAGADGGIQANVDGYTAQ